MYKTPNVSHNLLHIIQDKPDLLFCYLKPPVHHNPQFPHTQNDYYYSYADVSKILFRIIPTDSHFSALTAVYTKISVHIKMHISVIMEYSSIKPLQQISESSTLHEGMVQFGVKRHNPLPSFCITDRCHGWHNRLEAGFTFPRKDVTVSQLAQH